MGGMTALDIVAAVTAFGLMASVWFIGVLLVARVRAKRADKVRSRLAMGEGGGVRADEHEVRLFHEGREVAATLPGAGSKGLLASLRERVEHTCRQAGIGVPLPALLVAALGGAVAAFLAGMALAGSVMAGVTGGFAVVFAGWTYIKMRADKRAAKFDEQFVEALGMFARSLRAGHAMLTGLQMAANETPDPVRRVFAEVCQQHELGVNLEDALRRVAKEHTSADLNLFATSVAIQMRSGGNLATTIERIAMVIRERLKLGRRVRVLTAQTTLSKRVLAGMPVLVFALLNFINPEYMDPLYRTDAGRMVLTVGVAVLLVGMFVMNKMSRLKF